MTIRSLPNRLLLFRDTASGVTKVGWATDTVEDRFEILEVLCETDTSTPILASSPYYDHYRTACAQARDLNARAIEDQKRQYLSLGWYYVPHDLDVSVELKEDDFGCFLEVARTTLYRLSGNSDEVWAVVQSEKVIALRPRTPAQQMEELEYRVWEANIRHQLAEFGGEILQGNLVALESGLWLHPSEA